MGHHHTGFLADLFLDSPTDIDCDTVELKQLILNRQSNRHNSPRIVFSKKDSHASFFLIYDPFTHHFYFLNRIDLPISFSRSHSLSLPSIRKLAYLDTDDSVTVLREFQHLVPHPERYLKSGLV